MKKTVLETTQDILVALNMESVDTISASPEAEQIVTLLEMVYYEIVSTEEFPEHAGLLKLTAASDSTQPTVFTLPDNVRKVDEVWYRDNDAEGMPYKEIKWYEPYEFLQTTDSRNGTSVVEATEATSGTILKIYSDRDPRFYTSFDDNTIVMDSYWSDYDTTLQESKVRAWGYTTPVFVRSDDWVIDLDQGHQSSLRLETLNRATDLDRGFASRDMSRQARNLSSRLNNNRIAVGKRNKPRNYGR